jgi:transcriptional regulator with XRE-family HTH domain
MRERFNLTERYGPIDEALVAQFHRQMDLAQELYDLRSERGLSQEDVAGLLGVKPAVIESIEESDYEAVRTHQLLEKLKKALGADPAPSLTAGTTVGAV